MPDQIFQHPALEDGKLKMGAAFKFDFYNDAIDGVEFGVGRGSCEIQPRRTYRPLLKISVRTPVLVLGKICALRAGVILLVTANARS